MMWAAAAAPIRAMLFDNHGGFEQLIVTQDNGVFSWRVDVSSGTNLIMIALTTVCMRLSNVVRPAQSPQAPMAPRFPCGASVAVLTEPTDAPAFIQNDGLRRLWCLRGMTPVSVPSSPGAAGTVASPDSISAAPGLDVAPESLCFMSEESATRAAVPRVYVQRFKTCADALPIGASPLVWVHVAVEEHAMRSVELKFVEGRQVAVTFEVRMCRLHL